MITHLSPKEHYKQSIATIAACLRVEESVIEAWLSKNRFDPNRNRNRDIIMDYANEIADNLTSPELIEDLKNTFAKYQQDEKEKHEYVNSLKQIVSEEKEKILSQQQLQLIAYLQANKLDEHELNSLSRSLMGARWANQYRKKLDKLKL